MTVGGSERHNFIISVEYQSNDAVSRALRAGQDIRRATLEGLGPPIDLNQGIRQATSTRNAANQFQRAPLSPGVLELFEKSIRGTIVTTRSYAEQLSFAAAQLRKSALTANDKDAKTRIAAAQELEATARVERSARTVIKARENAATAYDKERAQISEAAGARAALAALQPAYAAPNLRTGLGQAQERVNRTQLDLAIATERLTKLETGGVYTFEQLFAAVKQHTAAEASLAAAEERVRAAAQVQRPGASTFGQQFGAGFKGASETPYAQQLGQAFKFSLFYGTAYRLLSALTQTFQQTLQEGIEFQQAITELRISAGRADENVDELAEVLGQRAVEAGQAPSAGVLVGARSLGLYGATQAPAAQQARIAEESARVVSRLALASGQSAADLQTNIAAIVNAFGGGPEAQFRVADIDAYMAHRFGIAPGATIQAVSEAGTVGAAAGFSQEEVNAIAAALMARTGQTAPAVAGFMAQIFSRGGEGSLTAVAGRYGIDPTAELADQIKALSEVYKTAAPQERAELSAAFGRGKVQNAAIALLQTFDDVEQAAKEAAGGEAAGAADESFRLRMDNIGGQIALTTATLKEFANQLGQAGVLQALGAATIVFRELVEAATGLLRMWNEMPGAIKAVLVSLGLLTVAARTSAANQLLASRLGVFRGAAGGPGSIIRTGPTTVAPLASRAGAAALGGAAFSALGGPVTLAIGGLLAIGQLKATSEALADAQKSASATLNSPALLPGASPDDYLARASAMQAAAADAREQAGGFFSQFIGGDQLKQTASQLEDEAKRLTEVAKHADDAAKEATVSNSALIASFDPAALSDSLSRIASSGGSAKDQMDALAASIRGGGEAADAAAEAFDPKKAGGELAGGVMESLLAATPEITPDSLINRLATGGPPAAGINLGFGPQGKDVINEKIREKLTEGDIAKQLGTSLAGFGSLADLDPATAREIATTITDEATADLIDEGMAKGEQGPALLAELDAQKSKYVKAVTDFLLGQGQGVRDIVEKGAILNDTEVTAAVQTYVTLLNEQLGTMQETDYGGRGQAIAAAIRRVQQAIAANPAGPTSDNLEQLDALNRLLAESQITRLEAMRKVAQQNATGAAQVASVGRSFLRREINVAIRGGSQDKLVELVGIAGAYGKQIALDAINDAIRVAKAAIKLRNDSFALFQNQLTRFTGLGPDNSAAQAEIDKLNEIRDAVQGAIHGTAENDPYATGSDAGLGGGAEAGETAADRAVARAQAYASRSESAIQQAKAQIFAAKVAMDQAKPGTVEYYNALGQYFEARNALTDAIADYQHNLTLLRIDTTDPVEMAQAAVREAARKLRSDRGKGKDVIAADRVALEQAQTEAEATAFQTRLESVQTAEQLGRISHSAYIRYLENESRRLERIKHRTYQQQQQLNEIDGLLQSAAKEMEGQWNFGDIKLPTPYQMRRIVAERSDQLVGAAANARSLGGSAPAGGVQNITFDIDGADTAKVEKIIRDVVGGQQTINVRTHAARRGR